MKNTHTINRHIQQRIIVCIKKYGRKSQGEVLESGLMGVWGCTVQKSAEDPPNLV